LQRIAAFEDRLPELPPLPTQARLAALDADIGGINASGLGSERLLAAGKGRRGGADVAIAKGPAEARQDVQLLAGGGAQGDIIVAGDNGEEAQEEGSCLFRDVGFYVTQCLPFLPKATPEQHFQTLGLRSKLSREQWESFVCAEIASLKEVAARKAQRRRSRRIRADPTGRVTRSHRDERPVHNDSGEERSDRGHQRQHEEEETRRKRERADEAPERSRRRETRRSQLRSRDR
jgi:hypothetical protein